MGVPRFILASASPARRRLLQGVGIDPIVRPSDFDESLVQIPDPAELVNTLALRKAETVINQLVPSPDPVLLLGCDSILAIDGEIHGKPGSAAEAISRWHQMRGQTGKLYTGHALVEVKGTGGRGQELGIRDQRAGAAPGKKGTTGQENKNTHPSSPIPYPSPFIPHTRKLVRYQMTQVHFATVTDRQIAAYVATGEPLNCAGCFALEGKGGAFVERLEGCHSNVIGLSLPLLRQMLEELGYDIADFW
jgi:septum formation protein